MQLEDLGRKFAMARTQFQDARTGDVGHHIQCGAGVLFVQIEQCAQPVEHPDDLLLDLIGRVVAVEVLQRIGLESTIQP
jgi:hypothetical protein